MQSIKLSPSQGGFMSMEEYYAQKDAEEMEGQRQQDRSNWLAQPISQADVNAPEYGHKYYSTLGNQGPQAVAGLPVPKNYAPPMEISVTPQDRGVDPGRAGGAKTLPWDKIAQVGRVVKENSQPQPDPQQGQSPRVGLSALQNQQQPTMQEQGQPQVAPTQVQAAQAILGTVQNGTPRETIQAVMQATGMRGNIVPSKDGSISIVGEDGRALHSFNGLQDVVAYAYKHLGDNAGLPDHYLSLDQKEARRKDQMRTNEKLVDYMAQIENRNYQRQADREKMDMNSQAKIDEYNRSLAVLYAKELHAAQKAHKLDLIYGDKSFDRETFDRSFDEGLARYGVAPKLGGRMSPMNLDARPQSGSDWSGLPAYGGSSPQVGLGRPQAITPEYQDLYTLGQNMRGRQDVPQPAQQSQPQQGQRQAQQWGSLKELQAAVSGGQVPRSQAEQYAKQQGWIRPATAPPQTVPVRSAPEQQQTPPTVGLSTMQQDQAPPVPYLDNPGAYVPNAEGVNTYSPYAQGNAVRRVVTKPDTSRLTAYLAALKAQGGDAAVEQYLRYANQAGSGRRPYGNGR